jgi:hypothetical protein
MRRIFDYWANFRLLGDFSTIGRIFDYWANFRLLGEFSTIGRIFDYWANFRLLGEFSTIGRIFDYCAIVYFGQRFEKDSRGENFFWLLVFTVPVMY